MRGRQRVRVGLTPAQVVERLVSAQGVRKVARLPDLGDAIAGNVSFLVRADSRSFEIVHAVSAGTRDRIAAAVADAGQDSLAADASDTVASNDAVAGHGASSTGPLTRAGAAAAGVAAAASAHAEQRSALPEKAVVGSRYEQGGGVLPSARLVGRIAEAPEGSIVEVGVEWDRSARSWSRWLGLCVTGTLASIWVVVGTGPFYQRLGLVIAFALLVTPVVISDVLRLRRGKREELDLLAMFQGALGPFVLDLAHEPYRRLELSFPALASASHASAGARSRGRASQAGRHSPSDRREDHDHQDDEDDEDDEDERPEHSGADNEADTVDARAKFDAGEPQRDPSRDRDHHRAAPRGDDDREA